MPLISIIVPVYKVKEIYLRQCIESLIDQTYYNIEIILVNDGTPDNGGVICDEYAKNDSRIKVIHQKNQGASVARNNGMKLASGEWITFVDADDWIELDTCEKLKNAIMKEKMDFLIFALKVNFTNRVVENPFWNKKFASLDRKSREELQIQIFYKTLSSFSPPYNMVGVAVCKLYKASFLKKYDLKFNSELLLSEDGVFAFWALENANKVYYLNEFLYHYRRHRDSATNQYRKNAETDYRLGVEELEKCLIVTNKNSRFYTALNYRVILNLFAICNQLYFHENNTESFTQKIRSLKALYYSEPYLSAIKKVGIKNYSKNSGYFQKVGYSLLKFRAFFLFYFFFKFSNLFRKLKRIKR